MDELSHALRQLIETNKQLVEQNRQIVEKLETIQRDLKSEREERHARRQFKAQAYRDLDIQYIMRKKGVSAEEAAAKLKEHDYDIAKCIKSWAGHSEVSQDKALLHSAHKKNLAVLNMW